jgi:hypothetical protein
MKCLGLAAFAALAVACGPGPEGPPGPAGPAGPSGITVLSDRGCIRQPTSGFGYAFRYQVVKYSNGDVLTSCAVVDGGFEYGATFFFRSAQSGAASGQCVVGYDLNNYSGGYWVFHNDAPGERAIYHDPDSGFDGLVLSMTGTCA